jgi:transposase
LVETEVAGHISKVGAAGVRTMLYVAANIVWTRPVKGSPQKNKVARLAACSGMRNAKAALARILAAVLHEVSADSTSFAGHRAAAVA